MASRRSICREGLVRPIQAPQQGADVGMGGRIAQSKLGIIAIGGVGRLAHHLEVRRSSARASAYRPREYIGPLSAWIVFARTAETPSIPARTRPAGRDAISFSTSPRPCATRPPTLPHDPRVKPPADAVHGPGFDQVDGLGHAVGRASAPDDRQRLVVGHLFRRPVGQDLLVGSPGPSGSAPGPTGSCRRPRARRPGRVGWRSLCGRLPGPRSRCRCRQ